MPKADSVNPLFHRIYSVYFKTVCKIINAATPVSETEAKINHRDIKQIVKDEAFKVSHMEIVDKLCEPWILFNTSDKTTYITKLSNITRPQTTLEKQWLHTIAKDQRSKLFDINIPDDKKLQPLHTPDMWAMYDKFQDGDDYQNPTYIKNFKTILKAIKEERYLNFEYLSNKTLTIIRINDIIPLKLEYSPKNDKFRLLAITDNIFGIYNLNNIQGECQTQGKISQNLLQNAKTFKPAKKTAVLEIINDRKALQRALLAFSDYKKSVFYVKQDRNFDVYRMELEYIALDEKELLIRILSMGHLVKVIASESLIEQIKKRIQVQANLFSKVLPR